MTPTQIDRVFGRGRLKMVTGEHVEVFREAVGAGERRRYTKRFLNTTDGNFAHWTEREWRILARLIGHGIDCVPDVVQFDRGSIDGAQLVQTYDAGATVDQWATLIPLHRNGRVHRHAFEDCAHWWALAHHSLVALKKIHQLELVHLDVKGDNVCIPIGPATFDPDAPNARLHPVFAQLALIDFAFALVSGEALAHPLPIGWQRDYDYQSPRLLKALEEGRNGDLRLTRQLDWRCDIYSLAAMLKRYLPDEDAVDRAAGTGWNADRCDAAKALILSLREHHDRDVPHVLPHSALIHTTSARLRERDLAHSLASGWALARDVDVVPNGGSPLTPMTRLAPSIRVFVSPQARIDDAPTTVDASRYDAIPRIVPNREGAPRAHPAAATRPPIAAVLLIAFSLATVAALVVFPDVSRAALDRAWTWAANMLPHARTSVAAMEPPTTPTPPPSPAPSPQDAAAASTPSETAVPKETATPRETATPKESATPKETAVPKEIATPSASPAPAQNSPPHATPPVLANARPSAPAVAAPPPARKAGPSTKLASAPASKAKASGTNSSSATPATPHATASSKTPPRNASLASARVAPPSTPRPVSVSSSAPSGVAHAQAAMKSEPQPTPPIVTASAPVVDHGTAAIPSQAASATRGATDPEPIVSAEIAETPTSPPPAPIRERKNPSRIEKFIDQGWLSKLLRLGNNKPAPIEDRRLQGSPAKKAPMDPVEANPPAQLAQAEASPLPKAPKVVPAPPPDKPTTDAWRAVELQERIPPATQAIPEVAIDADLGDADLVFASEGRRALRESVPRIAVEAQSEVARVLWVAANATDSAQDRAIIDAAQSMRIADRAQGFAQKIAPAEARRLNAEASDAYWVRRNNAETFDLQLKAFGANPYDAEVAGNFALMHLKVSRPQPEMARQLALIAIAYRGARSRTGRFEDWTTFAIASALTGRSADARNAFFVTIALSPTIERTCRSAQNALSNYGERLREPVEAMLYRIHTQGRAHESSACLWPRRWAMSSATQ